MTNNSLNAASIDTVIDNKLGNDITGIPLFIKNNGQWKSDILFRARLSFADLYIRQNGISLIKIDRTLFKEDGHYHGKDGKINGVRVDMNFDNVNPNIAFIPKKKGKVPHHFILPSTVSVTAFAYSMVYAKSVFKGIDWRIYTTIFGEIKHEFILRPGADVKKIKLLFEGQNELLVSNKKLEIKTDYGSIFEKPPYSFYMSNKEKIPTQYRIKDNRVEFVLPKNYNKMQSLVIDPTLIFSTYSGSLGDNWGYTGTYGENGTGYSAGIVFDVGFPTTRGSFQVNFHNVVDIGVLKYNASGSDLLYATYLGGDDVDVPHSILLDQNNNLLVFGTTSSTDFPITPNTFQSRIKLNPQVSRQVAGPSVRNSDLFVARLSSSGKILLHSTYIGGLGRDGINSPLTPDPITPGRMLVKVLYYNYGDSYRGDLAIDDIGNIYVSSVTESTDFPIVNAFQNTFGGGSRDGIIFKLSANMDELLWSTYVGGNRGDTLYNMKVLNNKIIVCGGTFSTNAFLPTQGKFIEDFSGKDKPTTVQADGIALNLNKTTGRVTEATYLGTTSGDQAYFIDSDSEGNIFVLGQTHGKYPRTDNTFGVTHAGLFLQKLSPDLSTGLLSTTLGTADSSSQPNISLTAFLVSNCGDIYITGFSQFGLFSGFALPNTSITLEIGFDSSTKGLPTTFDAHQSTTDGSDFYLMILSKDAKKLNYATFFGGVDLDERGRNLGGEHVDGGTNRFDKSGTVYHAVCAGCRGRNSFPTTPNAFSNFNRSNNCNNGFFKFDLLKLRPQFSTNTRDLNNFNVHNGCAPFSLLFSNTTNGDGTFIWDFGDGTTLTKNDKTDILHTYNNPGNYTVTLTAKNENSCITNDLTFSVQISVDKIDYDVVQNTKICSGESADLFVTNATNITWKNLSTGKIISNQPRFTVIPTNTTEYELNAVIGTNCQIKKNIIVTVAPHLSISFDMMKPNFSKNETSFCLDSTSDATIEFKNTSSYGENFPQIFNPSLPLVDASPSYTDGIVFDWDFGDGHVVSDYNSPSIAHQYNKFGEYTVKLVARDLKACEQLVSFERTIEIKSSSSEKEVLMVCLGDAVTLSASNLNNISWLANETIISNQPVLTLQPSKDTTYSARGISSNGCPSTKEIDVKFYYVNNVQVKQINNHSCTSDNKIEIEVQHHIIHEEGKKEISPADKSKFNLVIDMGDGTTYDTPHVIHEYRNKGTYTVTAKLAQEKCEQVRKLQVTIPNIYVPNVITPNGDYKNDKLIINRNKNVSLKIYDRWGNKVYDTKNYQNEWPTDEEKYHGVFNYEINLKQKEVCNGWVEVRSH